MHGLLTHKKYEDSNEKQISGTPPTPLKKPILGRTKAKMGRFSQKGLCYNFEILHGLLTNKNIRILMKKKDFWDPPSPPKKPILGGKKPKWAVSPRRVCATVLKFYRGS